MYYASIPALVIERTLVAKQQTTRRHRTNPDSVQYVTSPLRQRIQPPVVHLTNSAEKKSKEFRGIHLMVMGVGGQCGPLHRHAGQKKVGTAHTCVVK